MAAAAGVEKAGNSIRQASPISEPRRRAAPTLFRAVQNCTAKLGAASCTRKTTVHYLHPGKADKLPPSHQKTPSANQCALVQLILFSSSLSFSAVLPATSRSPSIGSSRQVTLPALRSVRSKMRTSYAARR